MSVLPYVVAVWLLLIGLYGVMTSRHLVHLVICLGVAQSSTYVLLLAVGYRVGGRGPIFADLSPRPPVVAPVVQALPLTDIVVQPTAAAVPLALPARAASSFGTADPDRL